MSRSTRAWVNETEALGKTPVGIGAMTDDQAGNVWFGFSNKVVEWDGSNCHRFSFPDGKRGVSENTMFVRGRHVWLGGVGGVLAAYQGPADAAGIEWESALFRKVKEEVKASRGIR